MNSIRGLLIVVLSYVVGCSANGVLGGRRAVDVEIVNRSSGGLENAEVSFGDRVCGWGWVAKGARKVYVLFPHPITSNAELRWESGGKRIVRSLKLDQVYKPGTSGSLEVAVYDDHINISFRGEK